MSGIAMVAAAYSPPAPPTSSGPLSCWISFAPDGNTMFNVAGASGFVPGIVQSNYSGGTPPITQTVTFQNDPSGKLSILDNGHGVDGIHYAGFSLNEVEGGWISYAVTDHAGAKATARFPASGSISITRTS